MRILIATGIYPPAIGGPAKYAENLKNEWEKMGHSVKVKTYGLEHNLPTGIRHLYYFLKIIPAVLRSDFIYALDTFSVGLPSALAAVIFVKKMVLRSGGDFLWEGYVERTGDLVLLKDFYNMPKEKWSRKEKIIFWLTKWTLHHVKTLIFSTNWQKDIWTGPYGIKALRIKIIENYYGEKMPSLPPAEKNFIAGTRKIKWKNLATLEKSFEGIEEAKLDLKNYSHDEFMKKISECYAVILVSLGDISPNMILEAIRYNKPFIITEENGLMDRIGEIAITVNPKAENDIKEKILWLCKKENYDAQAEKIRNFNFTHTWEDIARETLNTL
ncbi:MAG: hypothetical protein Q8Q03_02780 [bacterium]|nr:hypothetical protein [bacterium]